MRKQVLSALGAATLALCAGQAQALNIVLWDTSNSFGTAPHGAEALFAFQKAANYWNKTLTNDVTVNIQISFDALPDGVLGSTGSASQVVAVTDAYARLAATKTSALDQIAVANLSALSATGGLTVRMNNYADVANKVGVAADATRLVSGNLDSTRYLDVNQSVVKALGLTSLTGPAQQFDANIKFSSNFGFDFNPSNGIDAGKYDFTAVAIHELGHALGFVSGTDTFDVLAHGKGPFAAQFENGDFGDKNTDGWAIGSTLDLFRYGNALNGNSLALQWSAAPNRAAFFSIDGKHVFNLPDVDQEAGFFSTGRYNGDGQQASHWKDNLGAIDPDTGGACLFETRAIGIMDPTSSPCHQGAITQNDIAAFDAMGWNTSFDVLANGKYSITSGGAFAMEGLAAAVPEPATWAQLLLGFGLIGGFLRARRRGGDAA
jgi:hypothetical protein